MIKSRSGIKITTSSDIDEVITFPPEEGAQIILRNLRVVGGSATSDIRIFSPGNKGKTTTNTAAAANAGDLQLAGDAGLNDTLNGEVYAAGDWVLVNLDTPRFLDALNTWQLMQIASVGGATAGTVDLATLTASDGENAPQNAVASGSTAYLMLAEDVYTELIGSSTKQFDSGGNAFIYAGKPGHPLCLHLEAGGATAHEMQATVEYVQVT